MNPILGWLDLFFGIPTELDGDADTGVATVAARKTLLTYNPKFPAFTDQAEANLTGSSQTTLFDGYTVPVSTSVKINVAIIMSDANDCASWDISFLVRKKASGAATIQGTAPGNVAGDNASSGASSWRATVDIDTDRPRVRVTGANGVRVECFYQALPVLTT